MSPLLPRVRFRLATRLFAVGAFGLVGCAQPRSLSITMYNAETGTTLTCSARQGTMKELQPLYDAVETCARQLEARGFVRMDRAPGK